MISDVSYSKRKGVYIEYYKDGVYQEIKYEQIKEAWPRVLFEDEEIEEVEENEEDEECKYDGEYAEYSRFHVWNEYIAFIILVANGQGGTIFVWDTNSMEFVHYSEGSYCCDFATDFSAIFLLCEISNYVTPYHLEIYRIPFGTKKLNDSGKRMYCEVPHSYECGKSWDDYGLMINDNKSLYVIAADGEHLYSSNIDEIEKQKPNENFPDLYKEWENSMDPGKIVLRGMIT